MTAFFELVKNSYDADATEVRITFHDSTSAAGRITIQDDGSGMTEEEIREDYLRVGGENKVREEYSPKFHRRRLGAKGIGRFSAYKLGDGVKVITRPVGTAKEIRLTIDADEFTDDKNLEDVELRLTKGTPRNFFPRGMIVEISRLRDRWGRREILRIRGHLSHLISPDKQQQSFVIRLQCDEFPEHSGLLESPIAGKESHRIRFAIDAAGNYTREVEISGKVTDRVRESREPLSCGPTNGAIRYYKEGLRTIERRLSQDTDESHMGVKVYRDGCRVRPYGEESDDWLGIKTRRSRGGGKYYVKPQAVAGSVYISATDNPELRDATDREGGMDDNPSLEDFRVFVGEQVVYLNTVLEQETQSESQRRKRQTLKKILDTVVDCLNQKESDVYRDYVAKLDRSKSGNASFTTKKPSVRSIDQARPTKEEWCCRGCDARWRVLKGQTPRKCGNLAVNRSGQPRKMEGCGSANIERAKHQSRGSSTPLGSVVSGTYALIGGRQVSIRVDYEAGASEDEYVVDEREIVINGNHPAFVVAQALDQVSGKKYELGDDIFVPALTVHITKCTSLAWGELHYQETKSWQEYKARYDDLQDTICAAVQRQLGV